MSDEHHESIQGSSNGFFRSSVSSFVYGRGESQSGIEDERLLVVQERLRKELAVKDEAIRNLQALLLEVSAASPRRPRLEGAENIFLEKMFMTREPQYHAFPSSFASDDWESNTDVRTQLVLSLLRAATGLHILSLQASTRADSLVVYSASCRLDVFVSVGQDLRAYPFAFDLHFDFAIESGSTATAPGQNNLSRIVRYEPHLFENLSSAFLEHMGPYSYSSTFDLNSLTIFIQDLFSRLSNSFALDARSQLDMDMP
ncbi:hypothetical protein VNI00_013390 [Paramarasmius palmivorus]|uniref:Uncharacterized protein n=1 Tax=Paramarasmius palmivorus TaxID=297713 RepID=A0AAW0C0Y2_9AGAR